MYIAGQPGRSRRPGTGNVEATGSAGRQRLDIRPTLATAACTRTSALRIVALLVFAVSGAGCATMIPRDVVPERLVDEAELAGISNVRVWGDASTESLAAFSGTRKPKIDALVEARRRSGRQSSEINIQGYRSGFQGYRWMKEPPGLGNKPNLTIPPDRKPSGVALSLPN